MSKRIYTILKRAFGSTNIPTGADLNNYKAVGRYYLSALSNYTNAPTGYDTLSAYMQISKQYNPNSASYIEQRLTLGSNYIEFARRWGTDSWSAWKITGSSVDEIVAQGTSGIWTYRKWYSGIAECWGTYRGTIGRYTGTLGLGPCVSGYTSSWDLPFAFTQLYTKTATAQVGTGICVVTSGGLNDALDKVAFHWASNVTSGTSTVNMSIKGRWK